MKVARNLFKADLFREEQTATTRKGRMKPLRHEMPTRAVHADPTRREPRLGSVGVGVRAGGCRPFETNH
jgi:hypothetical protein